MNNKNGNGRSLPLLVIAALGVVLETLEHHPYTHLNCPLRQLKDRGLVLLHPCLEFYH